jgi:hypothetical protein
MGAMDFQFVFSSIAGMCICFRLMSIYDDITAYLSSHVDILNRLPYC